MPSFANNMRPSLRTRRRHQRGQSAVVALLVLLLLSFIGALFITIIARNLRTQGRSHRTLNADYYAEAGLRYADDQLTSSLDGADWRPPLQYQVTGQALPGDAVGSARYAALVASGTLPAARPSDPDLTYLQQGFVRYNTQSGRFLLRVTYNPVLGSTTSDPTARYLKIESVGREGTVNPIDPTTYQNQPPTRLLATVVAYKPIGITDYARFDTNLDQRSGTANVGVPSLYHATTGAGDPTASGIVTPGVFDFYSNQANNPPTLVLAQYPVVTTLGADNAYMTTNGSTSPIYPNPFAGLIDYSTGTPRPAVPSGYTPVAGGGSLRANMDLRLFGKNVAYLNRTLGTTALDDIEIAGRLLLDNYQPTNSASNLSTNQPAALILNNPFSSTETDYVAPSNGYDPIKQVGTPFDTHGGAVRDGGSGGDASDASGSPRSVARLDPPVIDNASSATHLTRYQDITENSPPRTDPVTGLPYTAPNAALAGYGRAVYVNNVSDVQRDSPSLVGGHTLVDEWLNANPGGQAPTTAKGGWVGPFYNPPGAEIVFGQQRVIGSQDSNGQYPTRFGFRITRSDVDTSGNPVQWEDLHTDPTGGTPLGPTMTVTYDELDASNPASPAGLTGTALTAFQANPNNDVLIYLEGNVRLLGIVSALTTPATGGAEDKFPRHVTIVTNGTAYIDGNLLKGNSDSSITVLARDYVCVNTTQFLAGAAETYPTVSGGLLTFNQDSDQFVQEFSFGLTPAMAYPNASPMGSGGTTTPPLTPLALYVSGGAGSSGSVVADFDIANPLIRTTQDLPEGIRSGATPGNPFDSPIVGPPGSALFSGLFDSTTLAPGVSVTGPSLVTHTTYSLYNLGLDANSQPLYNTLLDASPQQPFQLWTRRDPGADAANNPLATSYAPDQPFQLERAAILPMDIRIEAVLYAQNKSFFVIPGPWFNSDSGDTVDSFAGGTARPGIIDMTPGPSGNIDQWRFPFYGQPLDLKITVVGAVSEARPADIAAQAAWMQRWGWIPKYHGSIAVAGGTTLVYEPAGHPSADPQNALPATSLALVYDPQAGYPFDAGTNSYLRTDLYGRPLPVTPKLPVSTGLLYSGQNTGPSLLQ